MASIPFLEALARRVLVCDGAMGTLLYARGVFVNRCFESLNLTDPAFVADVHAAYLKAGADIIETNTFGANRVKLRAFGLGDEVAGINTQGAAAAREAAGGDAYVAGAIGPLGVRIEPWGKTGVDEATDYFMEQARALADGGVDLFILETFRDLNEISAAIAAVRAVSALPIVAQMTTEEDGNSLDGTPPETFAPVLAARGASVVGVNCSVGPAPMLETVERLASVTDAWLSAQPNAGRPRDIEGRNIYLSSPEYMASYARRFISGGVRLVGGCCGTTPEHIRQISLEVRAMAPDVARGEAPSPERPRVTIETPSAPPVARAGKSAFARALAAGTFVKGVEIVPPKGHGYEEAIACARELSTRGIDVVTVAEGPRSGARLSALSLAVLIRQQANIEPVLQYSCRDRNLLGIQSDLLGAHAMGLRNFVGITGDVRMLGAIPDATAVFDVDSIGLTHLVTRLNHGLDIGGQPIGPPTAFHVGVMVNSAAEDLEQELRRFAYKVEAGAEYVITRPVFDVAAFERFLARVERFGVPVLAGIWPFESAVNAEFMANEVPGVTVPRALVARMRETSGAEAARAEGVRIAREIAAEVAPMSAGVQVYSPSGRLALALDVLEGLDKGSTDPERF